MRPDGAGREKGRTCSLLRLATILARFMARTDEAMARNDNAIARLEGIVERREQEGAREREEGARERREMNKRWGELANKMGTVVEDIVAPSVRRLAREVFDCGEMQRFLTRASIFRSDDRSRRREFDALYVGTRAVLLNQTKSSPRAEDARAFVEFLQSGEFALYFPELGELPIVPGFQDSGGSVPVTITRPVTTMPLVLQALQAVCRLGHS